jgi:hypothetical protein
MTLRTVNPASGANQLTVTWGGSPGGPPSTEVLCKGQVLDVLPGSALETAIGAGNLTALTGNTLNNDLTGSEGSATANS